MEAEKPAEGWQSRATKMEPFRMGDVVGSLESLREVED